MKHADKFKKIRKRGDFADEQDDASSIEKLWQTVKNMGMQFSDSKFENATFVIHNTPVNGHVSEEEHKNLLSTANREELLKWCSKHYQDLHFAMLLAACILDRQPYQMIYQMAQELQKLFEKTADDDDDAGKSDWNFKSEITEVLGLIEYPDFTKIRGVQMEVDFLRLPVHAQAEQCIQLMVKEFSELKYALTKYLIKKTITVFGSRHNYMVVSGCLEALAFIGAADMLFFNEYILKAFLQEKSAGMDFCLSVLLGKLYWKKECRDFVVACVEQWGRLKNNPHCSLTVLYICGQLGKQEMLVYDIWVSILERLVEEVQLQNAGYAIQGMSYLDILQELFESGNRNISYYKGVVHAFYGRMQMADQLHKHGQRELLNTIFLLFLLDDYACSFVSGNPLNRRDMLWISIFKRLDERTGKELTWLWGLALDNYTHPKDGWRMLEKYLSEYEDYEEDDIEKLAFFFYHINQQMGRNRGILFLKKCAERKQNPIRIAEAIYKRIKE